MEVKFLNHKGNFQYESVRLIYEKFWSKKGNQVLETIESFSELKFSPHPVQVFIYSGYSFAKNIAREVFLRNTLPPETGKCILIHELCHQLLHDNGIAQGHFDKTGQVPISEKIVAHKLIYLILYDVCESLFGQSLADKSVQFEKGLLVNKKHIYETAWNYALQFNKGQRANEFRKQIESYKKNARN